MIHATFYARINKQTLFVFIILTIIFCLITGLYDVNILLICLYQSSYLHCNKTCLHKRTSGSLLERLLLPFVMCAPFVWYIQYISEIMRIAFTLSKKISHLFVVHQLRDTEIGCRHNTWQADLLLCLQTYFCDTWAAAMGSMNYAFCS